MGIAGSIAFYVWRLHRIPLEPLSPELISEARKTEAMGGVALLITFFLN